MFIGVVCGAVVTTQKDEGMREAKLLLVEPLVARRGGAPGRGRRWSGRRLLVLLARRLLVLQLLVVLRGRRLR